jgi:hypothetical protein
LSIAVGGVASYLGGLSALGAILFAIFIVLYTCALCRCCCFKGVDNPAACCASIICCGCCPGVAGLKKEDAPKRASLCRWLNVMVFLAIGFIFVVLTFAAAAPAATMARGAHNTTMAIGSFIDAARGIHGGAKGINGNAGDGSGAARALVDSTDSAVTPTDKANARAADAGFGVIHAAFTPLLAGPLDQAQTETEDLSTATRGPQTYPGGVATGATIVMGLAVLFFIISALVPWMCCRVTHVTLSLILVLLMLLGWILIGGLFSGALFVSDFCVDPGRTSVTFLRGLNVTNPNLRMLVDTGAYYVSCTNTPPAVPVDATWIGVLNRAENNLTSSGFNASVNAIGARRSALTGPAQTDATTIVMKRDAIGSFAAPGSGLWQLRKDTSCAAINPHFWNIVTPLCGVIVGEGLRPFFNLVLAALVLFIIFLGTNLTFIMEHPYSRKREAMKKELSL